MRIDLVYDNIKNDLRKTRNGFYPINQFERDAFRTCLDKFNKWFEGYSATESLHDALSPFKATPFVFTPSSSIGGLVTLPDDYGHLLSATAFLFSNDTGKGRKPIKFVTEDERDSALANQVRVVSKQNPIAVQDFKSIQLYPESAMSGEVRYLRLPKQPIYRYDTLGTRRKPQYIAKGSQDIEFTDLYMPEIIDGIIGYAQRYLDEMAKQTA